MPTVTVLEPTVPPAGERPPDIGTGHPMRLVTERVAADPSAWTPRQAAEVADFFGSMAAGWAGRSVAGHGPVALRDALERGGPLTGPAVELGPGTGEGTTALAERFGPVLAVDIAPEMLALLDVPSAGPVLGDASRLPLADRSVGTLVCMNMFLFTDEVGRVLREDGSLVWVSTLGDRTPIYLSPEALADALGDGFSVTTSTAGWSTWSVARRR